MSHAAVTSTDSTTADTAAGTAPDAYTTTANASVTTAAMGFGRLFLCIRGYLIDSVNLFTVTWR